MGKVFRKYGADAARIRVLVVAALAILLCAACWIYPPAGAVATLILIVALICMREKIRDALLPVRAYFIRERANKK